VVVGEQRPRLAEVVVDSEVENANGRARSMILIGLDGLNQRECPRLIELRR
jgi:hypothetical protein